MGVRARSGGPSLGQSEQAEARPGAGDAGDHQREVPWETPEGGVRDARGSRAELCA